MSVQGLRKIQETKLCCDVFKKVSPSHKQHVEQQSLKKCKMECLEVNREGEQWGDQDNLTFLHGFLRFPVQAHWAESYVGMGEIPAGVSPACSTHILCGITMPGRSGTGQQRQLDSCTCQHAKAVLGHATAQSNPVSNLEEWTAKYMPSKKHKPKQAYNTFIEMVSLHLIAFYGFCLNKMCPLWTYVRYH